MYDGVVIYLENQVYISINGVFSIATFDYQRGNITHTLIKVYPSVLSVSGYLPGKLVCSIVYDIVIYIYMLINHDQSINESINKSIKHISIYLSICLSNYIYMSLCLSVYLFICLSVYLSI